MAGGVLEAAAVATDADLALIARSTAGDRDAFDELVARRLARLYQTALAILRHDADAQDAVQEACVHAWRGLGRLRQADRFDAWLGRILVNSCRARLRTRRRSSVREIEMSLVEGRGLGAGAPLSDRVAELDAIRRAFARLKPDERILLGLHHGDRRSIEEIAALLRIPDGTAKWRLFAARRALAVALGREA